nr:unnamed protein product [Callosobruchus chinensis]
MQSREGQFDSSVIQP